MSCREVMEQGRQVVVAVDVAEWEGQLPQDLADNVSAHNAARRFHTQSGSPAIRGSVRSAIRV